MGFEIWLYRGIIGILLIVVWQVARNGWKGINEKFDELIAAVQERQIDDVKQSKDIQVLEKRVDKHENRLNDHSKRIQKIEIGNGRL
jgi:hypothetical protein